MRMSDGLGANVSSDEGNSTFLEDFEVFTFRDAVNVAAYMVMSAGQIIYAWSKNPLAP